MSPASVVQNHYPTKNMSVLYVTVLGSGMCRNVGALLIGPALVGLTQQRKQIGYYLGYIGFLSNQQTAGGFGIYRT